MAEALIKLQRKGQMVIPRYLREQVGLVEGTLMKVAVVEGGQFLLTPQVTIDRAIITHSRKDRKQALRELSQVVAEIRQEAREKGLDTMSKKEINHAVVAARSDLKKANKRPK